MKNATEIGAGAGVSRSFSLLSLLFFLRECKLKLDGAHASVSTFSFSFFCRFSCCRLFGGLFCFSRFSLRLAVIRIRICEYSSKTDRISPFSISDTGRLIFFCFHYGLGFFCVFCFTRKRSRESENRRVVGFCCVSSLVAGGGGFVCRSARKKNDSFFLARDRQGKERENERSQSARKE